MQRFSLRLRIFLFFVLIAVGVIAADVIALWAGHARAQSQGISAGFMFTGILAAFLSTALIAGIWLLFDENVARPIERLASGMRSRAHAGTQAPLHGEDAKYLGDLAPAADAVATQLDAAALDQANAIATETEALRQETARLTALLTEIPVATIVLGASGQIVLYDGQAASLLAQISQPRLNASIVDYLDAPSFTAAQSQMNRKGFEVTFNAKSTEGDTLGPARLRPLDSGGAMLTFDAPALAADQARPLVYDFQLLNQDSAGDLAQTKLTDLTYVVFDTETTGLLPHKDEIVQIGAVRVLRGRIIPNEKFDMLVDPGRPIPKRATAVHKISDDMVAGHPAPVDASQSFHKFCKNAVLVAHNAPFDLAFLRRAVQNEPVTWDHPVLDTVLLSAVLFGTNESHTLDALCERLNVTLPKDLRHTALGDAQATADVLCKLIPMLTARGFVTFQDVIAETKRHGRLLEDLN